MKLLSNINWKCNFFVRSYSTIHVRFFYVVAAFYFKLYINYI